MNGNNAKPNTLETALFMLELLKRIPRGRKIDAPRLHREMLAAGFQRDLRTVQRQLDELTRHFEIERDDRSKPYGYSWKPQARGLSVPGLSEKESLLLALAERHLCHLLPREVLRSVHPFFEQARSNLAPHVGGDAQWARDWRRKVRVVGTTPPLLAPRILPDVFDAASSALYADCWLEVHYRNAAGQDMQACVMPLGMAQQGTRLFLVCRFEEQAADRSLALHRVLRARNTNRPFDRPEDFDLDRFDGEDGFDSGSGRPIQLEMLVDKEAAVYLLESRLSEDQTEELDGDRYRIRATVVESEQLKWWLRGFGDAVEVLAPRELADGL